VVAVLSLFFLGSLITVGFIESGRLLPERKATVVVTAKNESYVNCHAENSPSIVQQWKDSRHAPLGVGCVDCHAAKKGEPDAWEHEGSLIATIVSPKYCTRCHEKVPKEFTDSHHSKATKSRK
jgi:hydroxylamine dehydrogenase